MPHHPTRCQRTGTTLLEVTLALALVGVTMSIAALPIRDWLDGHAVRQAARETVTLFAAARRAAIRYGGATVQLHPAGVRLEARDSLLRDQEFAVRLRVSLRSNTTTFTFGSTGLGRGVGNGTIILARGRRADTVVVSRLGRVRD
jgi:Tfp pilus assembly protein FimT